MRGAGNNSARGNARVSVLFANGTFGIWELDARNELQQVDFSPHHSRSLLAWLPLMLLTHRR